MRALAVAALVCTAPAAAQDQDVMPEHEWVGRSDAHGGAVVFEATRPHEYAYVRRVGLRCDGFERRLQLTFTGAFPNTTPRDVAAELVLDGAARPLSIRWARQGFENEYKLAVHIDPATLGAMTGARRLAVVFTNNGRAREQVAVPLDGFAPLAREHLGLCFQSRSSGGANAPEG